MADPLVPTSLPVRSTGVPRWRRAASALALGWLLVGASTLPADSQQSVSDARSEREQVREERAAAARELDAARADDEAVYAALTAITSSVNAQEAEIDEVRRRLGEAEAAVEAAGAAIAEADAREGELLAVLADQAVAGFVNSGDQSSALFGSRDITEALRQNSLLEQANGDTADLLEELRDIQEDRQLAEIAAEEAVVEAAALESGLAEDLVSLESEQAVQAELREEMARRVVEWESKVDELEAADAELTQFIREQEAAAAAAAAGSSGGSTAPRPGSPSVSGFQWPVSGSVTSGFGYRIHPIYGTRRLHNGLDISGGTGTPIAAAKAGTVIYAGWRGGYGNAVVIDHGDGITSLYAHQSSMNVSSGQSVGRGDVIGWVGSTGASTGPHLHFEIRVNGSPVNPSPYLP